MVFLEIPACLARSSIVNVRTPKRANCSVAIPKIRCLVSTTPLNLTAKLRKLFVCLKFPWFYLKILFQNELYCYRFKEYLIAYLIYNKYYF
jgi:hypothetical protein